MRGILLAAGIVAAMATASSGASAKPYTADGEWLMAGCGATDSPQLVYACDLYIMGVADALSEAHAADEHGKLFCLPSPYDEKLLSTAFLSYIMRHPDDVHRPAGLLAIRTLQEAFPCGGRR